MPLNVPRGLRALTLLGAASLLVACGGGNKDTPPAGAPAAVPSVSAASAPEVIKAALVQRFERLPPIDGVEPAPVAGLWEVRIGTDVYYTDASGDHLIRGEIIETTSRRNLTEERLAKLTAIDFASLPLKDAIVWKNGTGERKMAVFADPNCGYCKRFEQGLATVKNVTVYTFLYPVLGGDSPQKSEAIWCAKDRAAAWNALMRDGAPVPKMMGAVCDNPVARNMALGQKHRINGTPAIVFEDGTRVPGAISPDKIEARLAAARPS